MKDKHQVWSTFQVGLAAAIGGPVAGCYFLSRNCKTLGLRKQANQVLAAGILGTIALFLGLYLTPESILQHLPYPAIPASYTYIIVAYAKANIKAKMKLAARKSYLKFVVILAAFLLLQLLCLLLFSSSVG